MRMEDVMSDLSVRVTVDPTGSFKGIPESRLMAAAGYIPVFVLTAAADTETTKTRDVAESLLDSYGFGMNVDYSMLDNDAASFDTETGVHSYEGDPDLPPMVSFKVRDDYTVYVYQYGMVAVDDGETQWMQRFD